MKIKFINNSVSGVNRKYRGFTFELQGYTEKTIDVPSQYAGDLKKYLKNRHPAVQVIDVVEESISDNADQQSAQAENIEDITEDNGTDNTGKKNKKSGGKK